MINYNVSSISEPAFRQIMTLYGNVVLVGALGIYCADLSTIVQFGTDADQTIINSFFEGAKAGARWGRHIG